MFVARVVAEFRDCGVRSTVSPGPDRDRRRSDDATGCWRDDTLVGTVALGVMDERELRRICDASRVRLIGVV